MQRRAPICASRGLTPATQQRFRLGHAPDSRNALKELLAGKGVEKAQIEACGLTVFGDDVPVSYDRFRDRVMFPIPDSRGAIIAFGGRALSAEAPAKYLNTPETALFHKGNVLYNFRTARQALQKGGTLIAVEGYMDVIALAQAGFEAVVAPLGTALDEAQLELLWRLSPRAGALFRRRRRRGQGGMARRRPGVAADRARPHAPLRHPAGWQGPRRSRRARAAPRRSPPCSPRRARCPSCCGCARRGRSLRYAGKAGRPREAAARACRPDRRRQPALPLRARRCASRVQALFGASAARRPTGPRARRAARRPQRDSGSARARGPLAASERLTRSALVKRRTAAGPPLREATMVVALANHPAADRGAFRPDRQPRLGHPELRRLHARTARRAGTRQGG